MQIALGYFTSTGNTLWIVRHAERYMKDLGYEVKTFDVVEGNGEFFSEYKKIGLFFPVWGSDMPEPMKRVVNSLSDDAGRGRKIFIVSNYGLFSGDTGMFWKKRLEEKGFEVFYVNSIKMIENMHVPGFNMVKIPEGRSRSRLLEDARKELHKICRDVVKQLNTYGDSGFIKAVGGKVQRLFAHRFILRLKERFSVKEDRCTNCGLCVKLCPVGNISLESGKVEFGNECVVCLKCYNLCPEDAVLIGDKSSDTKKFRRYKGPSPDIRPVKYR